MSFSNPDSARAAAPTQADLPPNSTQESDQASPTPLVFLIKTNNNVSFLVEEKYNSEKIAIEESINGIRGTLDFRLLKNGEGQVVFFHTGCASFLERLPALLSRFFSDLLIANTLPSLSHSTHAQGSIERIRDAIAAQLDNEDLNMDDLAHFVGVSRNHLHRIVKKATGLSTTDYVHHVRIELACAMIRDTRQSIKEVAYNVGYKNPTHFSRMFKAVMQISPREYLRKCRIEL